MAEEVPHTILNAAAGHTADLAAYEASETGKQFIKDAKKNEADAAKKEAEAQEPVKVADPVHTEASVQAAASGDGGSKADSDTSDSDDKKTTKKAASSSK